MDTYLNVIQLKIIERLPELKRVKIKIDGINRGIIEAGKYVGVISKEHIRVMCNLTNSHISITDNHILHNEIEKEIVFIIGLYVLGGIRLDDSRLEGIKLKGSTEKKLQEQVTDLKEKLADTIRTVEDFEIETGWWVINNPPEEEE